MEQCFGLGVSLKMTATCVVDRAGKIGRKGMVTSDPEVTSTFVRLHALYVSAHKTPQRA